MFRKAPAETPKPRTLAQKIKDAELTAQLDAVERKAAFEREIEERERDLLRKAKAEKIKVEKKKIETAALRAKIDRVTPYLPLFLANGAAMIGQVGWALDHLELGEPGTPVRWVASLLFGLAAESIALFFQYHAGRALRNRDSAGSLYLSAFVVAAIVAAINFAHWSHPKDGEFFGEVNATAVIFALCSFISPWLWRVHSRAEHREILKAAGEIDTRGVKLSMIKKILYPVRSFRVVRLAAWKNETDPAKAVEMYETQRINRATVKAAEKAAKARKAEPVEKVTETGNALPVATQVPAAVVQPVPARPINGRRDMSAHAKWSDGLATFTASLDAGKPLNTAALAAALGQKNKVLASAIIRHVKQERGI